MRAKARDKRESGSVIAEFVIVFPAFLILSLFVLEVGLMWADRHIVRLAAFEAARVFAAGSLPEYKDGERFGDDPCAAPELARRARQAAVLKVAVISPPLPLFLAKLGVNLDFGALPRVDGTLGRLLRVAARWPTAVASTDVGCAFDPELKQVHVTVTYQRMLQTPLVDRVMFILYRLSKLGTNTQVELDANMFGLTTDSPAAVASVRETLKDALKTVERLDMNVGDAVPYLKGIAGLGSLFERLPSVPAEIVQLASQLEAQSGLLTSLVAAVPEALCRIPITADAVLQRDPFTARVDSTAALKEQAFEGDIKGVMPLDRGHADFRNFLRDLSRGNHPQDANFGAGAKAVEAIP